MPTDGDRGWIVNHKKVKRLMREHALHPPRRRRFVATTDSDYHEPVFPDRSRDCEIDGPNQLRVADLTYIAIFGGFVYLAAIMDAWSHRIVGYALGRRIDARLTLAALTTAIELRNPPAGCIHHSDRGSQYAAQAYRALLRGHGLVGSMARHGNPYDNAMMESFMKTLKVEGVYPMAFESEEDVARHLPRFIDSYNERRLHSAPSYLSPNRFEEEQPTSRSNRPPETVRPQGAHSTQPPHGISAAETQIEIDIGERPLGLRMPPEQDRADAQHVDGLRQQLMRRRGVRPAPQRSELLDDVSGVRMRDRLRLHIEVEPREFVLCIPGARQGPDGVEQFLLGQPHQRSPQQRDRAAGRRSGQYAESGSHPPTSRRLQLPEPGSHKAARRGLRSPPHFMRTCRSRPHTNAVVCPDSLCDIGVLSWER